MIVKTTKSQNLLTMKLLFIQNRFCSLCKAYFIQVSFKFHTILYQFDVCYHCNVFLVLLLWLFVSWYVYSSINFIILQNTSNVQILEGGRSCGSSRPVWSRPSSFFSELNGLNDKHSAQDHNPKVHLFLTKGWKFTLGT